MQQKWRALCLGGLAALGVMATSPIADAAAVTLCGTSSGDPDAINTYLSGCTWCHSTSSGGNPYIQGAFQTKPLADWLKSSYWSGEQSGASSGKVYTKAWAAYKRVQNLTMPPGVPVPTSSSYATLRNKIYSWITSTWSSCSNNFDPACVWGTWTQTTSGTGTSTASYFGDYTTVCKP